MRDGPEATVIRAFTEKSAQRLTGLSKRQLRYWDRKDFIRPSVARGSGRARRRLYGFTDLVSLRAAGQLRRDGVSLQLIRKVATYLKSLDYRAPLSEVRFWVWQGRLYFAESEVVRAGRRPEQAVMPYDVPVPAIVDSLRRDIQELDGRRVGEIERRRGVLGSKPVFADTRIPVASVRRLLKSGSTHAEVLAFYPDLTEADLTIAAEPPRRAGLAS
ncbi:MAG TPA: DUF433 domain-containing protein [Candidatus Dormibacteraeota bacterium]|nr:DUF433 domain-containing protein [Candidatus Dormibacteraeota bacterium]